MSSAEQLTYAYIEHHPTDAARVLDSIALQDSAQFIRAVPVRLAVPVVSDMLPSHAAGCLQLLPTETAAALLHAMEIQAGVAVMRYLPDSARDALLAQLPTALALSYRMLLAYSRDTAGGWMNPRAMLLTDDMTCDEVLAIVRQTERLDIDNLFVTDRQHHYLGRLVLGDIVRAQPDAHLARLVRRDPHALPAQARLSAIANHPGWRDNPVLAVIEKDHHCVGTISHGRVLQALEKYELPADEPHHNLLTDFTTAYWLGVSGLIEALIGLLPMGKASALDERPR